MVKQIRPQPMKPYDCIAQLKEMPKEFWLGVPTASNLPHAEAFDKKDAQVYAKRHFSQESWDMLTKHAHKLHPRWCKVKEQLFYGDHMGRHIPTHFAVYQLNGTTYVCYNSSGNESWHGKQEEVYQLDGGEWHTKGRDYTKYNADEGKFNTTWNRLRKDARRELGKEPDAKTAKARALADKQALSENKREEVLRTAQKTLACVQKYVKALKNNTADESDISEVYFSMIELAEQNKEYKEVAGILLKR